jgi:simple sugar transport system substrate-binding protein
MRRDPTRFRRRIAMRAVLPLLLLSAAAACGPAQPDPAANSRAGLRFVMVTHGQSADAFWSVVANGARDAARDLGVQVEYQAPLRFDMVEMSQRIEAAVASRPAGLIVSIPDADALGASLRSAVAAGIPVISVNSGDDAWRALGMLAHIGQTEYEAGVLAGERFGADGVRRALCINHEVGNDAQDRRCAGFSDALARANAVARVLGVNLADPEDTEQRVASALAADTAVDGVLTLGPAATDPTLAALERSNRAGRVAYATFDLTPRVLEAVRDGHMRFAIDQQQYLQGYLPVVLLVKYLETGAVPGGGRVIATGPGFVTRDNAAAVIDLATRGIR